MGRRLFAMLAAAPLGACASVPHSPAYGAGVSASRDDAFAQSVALVEIAPEDAEAIRAAVRGGRAVLFEVDGSRWRPVVGCEVRAAFAWDAFARIGDADVYGALARRAEAEMARREPRREGTAMGTPSVEVERAGTYRLDALGSNELPDEAGCARATHVAMAIEMGRYRATYMTPGQPSSWRAYRAAVPADPEDRVLLESGPQKGCAPSGTEHLDCNAPIAVTLVAIADGEPRTLARAAALTHIEARSAGDWSLASNQTGAFCSLPCDAWIVPGSEARIRDASTNRATGVPAMNAAPSTVVVTYEKERKDRTELALGWTMLGIGVVGAGLASYATYAIWSGSSSPGPTPSAASSSGSTGATSPSSGIASGGRDAAGAIVMPLMAIGCAALAGIGLWELVRPPGQVPVARKQSARSKARITDPGGPLLRF